jgi:hypothetical protein
MKTYKNFMEGFGKPKSKDDGEEKSKDNGEDFDMEWKDIKNRHIKKEAGKMLKALDKNEVLVYSAEHGEFTIFKNEMEYIKAQKGKGKAMKWIKVEGKSIDGNLLNEAFNFKGAVKHGFLDKSDEKYVKDLKKKGWDIDEFNLTSKGYEITIQHKKGGRARFVDKKSPGNVLKTASEKAV